LLGDLVLAEALGVQPSDLLTELRGQLVGPAGACPFGQQASQALCSVGSVPAPEGDRADGEAGGHLLIGGDLEAHTAVRCPSTFPPRYAVNPPQSSGSFQNLERATGRKYPPPTLRAQAGADHAEVPARLVHEGRSGGASCAALFPTTIPLSPDYCGDELSRAAENGTAGPTAGDGGPGVIHAHHAGHSAERELLGGWMERWRASIELLGGVAGSGNAVKGG